MAEPTSMQIAPAPQVVALSTSSAQSAAIGAANPAQPNGYTTCRVVSTVDAWLEIESDPTVVANTAPAFLLPANSVEYIDVPFGHKVGGIAAAAGYLSIAPARKL